MVLFIILNSSKVFPDSKISFSVRKAWLRLATLSEAESESEA